MEIPKHMIEEEIIMILTVKSLIKFKCVSKDWNNFISDNRFRRNYRSSQHSKSNNAPTGYICKYMCRNKPLINKEFLRTSESYVEGEQLKSVLSYLHDFDVISVAKGLLLLGNELDKSLLHIYDLVSKQHVILPKIHKEKSPDYKYTSFGFSCVEEEDTTTTVHHRRFHYKLVCIEDRKQRPDSSLPIWTFSSKTGTWNKSIMKAKSNFLLTVPDKASVIGGVFHWRCIVTNHIIAYDPDNLNGRAVLINIPSQYTPNRMFHDKLLEGTKDGYLQHINIKNMTIEVSILDTGERNYMDESIIDATNWVLTNSVSFWDIFSCFRDVEKKPFHYVVGVDPADANILYLRIEDQLYAYNHLDKIIVFKCSQLFTRELEYTNYFELPTWPSL